MVTILSKAFPYCQSQLRGERLGTDQVDPRKNIKRGEIESALLEKKDHYDFYFSCLINLPVSPEPSSANPSVVM